MSKNELIIHTPMLPALKTDSVGPNATVFVSYEKLSETDYRFTNKIDDKIDIQISKDRTGKYAQNGFDDIIDVDFEEQVPENELLYYGIALASGLLTGLLSNHISAKTLNEAKEVTEGEKKEPKALRSFILYAAKLCGFKGDDYKKSVKFLFQKYSIDVVRHLPAGVENAAIGELSGQPTIAGLAFSVLTQFSGKYYYLDEDGGIKVRKVSDSYVFGQDDEEKITLAVMYWFFYVCAGFMTMGKDAFEELKLPDGITKLVSMFCKFIIDNKAIPKNYEEAEEKFEKWLKEMQEQSREINAEADVFAIMKEKMGSISNQLFPVMLNEGLVRSSYTLCKLSYEVRKADVKSLEDIFAIDLKEIVPYNNRIMSNMCLIASSTFVAANIGPAVAKVAAKVIAAAAKGDKKSAITGLLGIITQVNIAGVGRFVIAFGDNSKYFNENLHIFFNNRKWDKFKKPGAKQGVEISQDENYKFEKGMEDILRLMMLDSTQTRILYSLENLLLEYDISRTKKPVEQEAKKEWSMVWQDQIGSMVDESPSTYFIHDEKWLYEELYKFADAESNHRWIYAMTMELCTFKPYAPLGTEEDKSYKGLKLESDYIGDKYVVRQTVVSHKDTELICKYFKHYKGMIDGSTKKLLIGAGSASAVAVAAGAAAFSFAPAIAVALVGNAFPGLHGIALVNAALAALGGGSLAAGGLGMAGGTAVITGGGALIGLTGTSAVTAATLMLSGSKEYWDNEFAKLLTFVKFILKDKLGETEKVVALKHHVALITELAENQLKEMKKDHTPLDKEAIERTENYVKYLRKLNGEMKKI